MFRLLWIAPAMLWVGGCAAGPAGAGSPAESALESATVFFADLIAWDGRLHPR
jgi:hypothetical protein